MVKTHWDAKVTSKHPNAHPSNNGALNLTWHPQDISRLNFGQCAFQIHKTSNHRGTQVSRAWIIFTKWTLMLMYDFLCKLDICVLILYLDLVSIALDLYPQNFLLQPNLDVLPPLNDMRSSVASVVSRFTANFSNVHNLKVNGPKIKSYWRRRRKQTNRCLKKNLLLNLK